MTHWTPLAIGETVHDKAFALVADHIGQVNKVLDDDLYEIIFKSGRVQVLSREDLGPLPPIDLDKFSPDTIKLLDGYFHLCFNCKGPVTPSEVYYNCFGLPRGKCPVCGNSVHLNRYNNPKYLEHPSVRYVLGLDK
jgi:hypothetical protein